MLGKWVKIVSEGQRLIEICMAKLKILIKQSQTTLHQPILLLKVLKY